MHIRTDEVYGDFSIEESTELSRLAPTNPYSSSKETAGMLVQTYMTCYRLNTKNIRSNNIFGSRQFIEMLIPRLFYFQDHELEFSIHGTGELKRHFLYLYELNSAVDIILQNWAMDKNKIYNVGALAEYSVNLVVGIVEQKIGKKIKKGLWKTFHTTINITEVTRRGLRHWVGNRLLNWKVVWSKLLLGELTFQQLIKLKFNANSLFVGPLAEVFDWNLRTQKVLVLMA